MAPGYIDPERLTFGFSGREFEDVVRERWGIDEITDIRARYPLKEGKYWPTGRINPNPEDSCV
jgi:hypothetical protein